MILIIRIIRAIRVIRIIPVIRVSRANRLTRGRSRNAESSFRKTYTHAHTPRTLCPSPELYGVLDRSYYSE
jgi:hypothetical protein